MVEASSSLTINFAPNQYYIIGSQGQQIPGYTDDVSLNTITGDRSKWANLVQSMTGNRVLISLSSNDYQNDLPNNHEFSSTYFVQGDTGVKDILVSQIENLDVGSISLKVI
jgi:hypothetical protein